MKQLDLLKQNWDKQDHSISKLSYNELYKMISKKSTSIVKWIFIISVLELLFWTGLMLITPSSSIEIIEKLGLTTTMTVATIVHYIIIIGFIYYFFNNYKNIKVTQNTRTLMQNIIKTRRTVKCFVIYNIVSFALTLLVLNVFYYLKSDVLLAFFEDSYGNTVYDPAFFKYFMIVQIVIGIVLVGLLLLFYRIIYGILLKRLYKNYHELKKIEV